MSNEPLTPVTIESLAITNIANSAQTSPSLRFVFGAVDRGQPLASGRDDSHTPASASHGRIGHHGDGCLVLPLQRHGLLGQRVGSNPGQQQGEAEVKGWVRGWPSAANGWLNLMAAGVIYVHHGNIQK